MELVGEEKRIQALFSELRLEDEQAGPGFEAVWHRAQSKTIRPRKAFSLSFVAATALLVCALVSLALWTRYSQRTQPPRAAVATVPPVSNSGPTLVAKDPEPKPTPSGTQRRFSATSRALKARQQAVLLATNQKAARDAKAIESWQSPTSALLSSPSSEVLTTLPQLNENSNELKSFLPSRPK